jgi:tryptophanyl-tRNA synthetase
MRVVSGIQPTGNLHLGNYLGAIRNWVKMQDEGECLFFLADLHAISLPHNPAELAANTREMAAALIACGIDTDKSILFNQARVPAHAELQWLLNGTARMGWLNRMTQFKDKAGKHREGASIALFTYPVLQAADVLLYQATHVPVGDDQKQHLELARDIAQKFNNDFGAGEEIFTLPDPIIPPEAARIMSLRDGSKKMSKSDPSDLSRINLTDDADTISKKIRKAKTDPASAARPRLRALKAGRKPKIWSASTQQWPGSALKRCLPNLRDRVSARSSPRSASCSLRNWRPLSSVSIDCGKIAMQSMLNCARVPTKQPFLRAPHWKGLTPRSACNGDHILQ